MYTLIQKNPLTGHQAFKTWICLAFNAGEKIWLKFSHNQFLTGSVKESGSFSVWETRGSGTNRRKTDYHADAFEFLSKCTSELDGGAFYIPGKPTDFPLKEYCPASDDVGAEMDDGTPEEQWQQIERISHLSGLIPAYIITSGSKSYHGHWKLAFSIPIAQRTFFSQLTAIALLGDPAVTNPHQPMRVPGFFRREKGKEQTLEYYSEARYTPEEFEAGMQRCFTALDFTWYGFEEFSQERWQEIRRVLAGKLPRAEKEVAIRHLLALPESELPENVRRRVLEKKRSERNERRTATGFIGGTANNLIDAIALASEKLGADAFDWSGHNWQWNGNKARGCCPWHASTTGTAGWIAPMQNGNGWGFACPTCTDNKQVNAFSYWWQLKNGINAVHPKGKEWVTAAKEFCSEAGVSIPELPKTEWVGNKEKLPPVCDGYRWWDDIGNWLGRFTKKMQNLAAGFAPKEEEELTAKTYKLSKELLFIPGRLPSFEEYRAMGLPVIVYGDGQRIICWSEMATKGYRQVLDTSMAGQGKSHDAGLAQPKQFGVDQLFYASREHRNPTTITIEEGCTDVPTRHNGLVSDPTQLTPLGFPYVRHPKPGEETNVTATCFRTPLFHAVAHKGYQLDVNQEAKVNPICKTCHLAGNCAGKDAEGKITSRVPGASFRRDRRDALVAPKIRIHLNSIPDFGHFKAEREAFSAAYDAILADLIRDDINNGRTIDIKKLSSLAEMIFIEKSPEIFAALEAKRHKAACIVDEASSQISSADTTEIGVAEFDATCMEIASKLPDDWEIIKPVVLPLRPFLAGEILQEKEDYYGWNDSAIHEIIKTLPSGLSEVIKRIEEATKVDLEELFEQPDTVDFDSVSKKDRKGGGVFRASAAYRRQGYRDVQEAVGKLPTRWLVPFLQVLMSGKAETTTDIVPWSGEEQENDSITDLLHGALRIKNRRLTIAVQNTHQMTVLSQMKFVIFMDATVDRETIATKLGYLSPDWIACCKQAPLPTPNLKVVQISGLGLLGKQRSDNLKERIAALLSTLKERHPDLGVIDHLKCKRDKSEGHWFKDNRGSNEFLGCSAILSFGAPFMDIGALQAEYTTLTSDRNVTRENSVFQSYVDKHVKAEITQWVGRLRANRRPNERLTCYIAIDMDLNFLAEHYPGADITCTRAMDICPEAASKVESNYQEMASAFAGLTKEGVEAKDISAQAIADKIGLTKGRVSQLAKSAFGDFENLKACLTLLVKGIYSKIKHPRKGSPPDMDSDLLWLAQEYFPLLLAEIKDNCDLLSEITQSMGVYGAKSIQMVFEAMTADAIFEYIGRFSALLPPLAQKNIYEQLLELDC